MRQGLCIPFPSYFGDAFVEPSISPLSSGLYFPQRERNSRRPRSVGRHHLFRQPHRKNSACLSKLKLHVRTITNRICHTKSIKAVSTPVTTARSPASIAR